MNDEDKNKIIILLIILLCMFLSYGFGLVTAIILCGLGV